MAGLGDGLLVQYEPIFPQAPVDMDFHYYETTEDGEQVLKIKTDGFVLAKSLDDLRPYVDLCKDKIIGFDTETTGLSYGEDHIVGFSLSVDSFTGIYVPIRHQTRIATKKKIDKLDANGNQILTKTGKVSTTTVTTYEYFDCEGNLDPKEALDLLYEILLGAKRVLIHNAEFDLNMLKFEGYDVNKIKFFDTLILPYLYDPEAKALGGLKALEKRVLGRTVPEFKEVLGKDAENFAFITPEQGYVYACCDTSGLVGVYEKMYPAVIELLSRYKHPLVFDGVPYNVLVKDNNIVKAFVDYYGHAKILIDRTKAQEYKEQLEKEQREVAEKIYTYFDRGVFNLSSNAIEFHAAMASKQINTGIISEKSGKMSFSKQSKDEMKRSLSKLKEGMANWKKISYINGKLDKASSSLAYNMSLPIVTYGEPYFNIKNTVNYLTLKDKEGRVLSLKDFWLTIKFMYQKEMEKVKILELIQRNNSLTKALSSYVDKLTQVDECYMRYRLKGTKSGRLSSGNGSKSDKKRNHYYIDLNAQNLTKPASAYYSAEKCSKKDPEGILGWKFTPLETDYALAHLDDLYIVEGQDPKPTIRGCLKAPEGVVCVAKVPDEHGVEEEEVFELSLEDGRKIECTSKTCFKVITHKVEAFMPLEEVQKRDELEVFTTSGTVKVDKITSLGVKKVKELNEKKTIINEIPMYSHGRVGSRYVVSLDYDAQEYKLIATLSRDSKMLSNFYNGIDPHTASAYAIWGEENYNKAKRKKAKIFNFLNNYSGGAYTLAQQLDIPVSEAQDMIDKYNATFHEMVEWKNSEILKMYQNNGVVFTAFGRPRQFCGWMSAITRNRENYTTLLEKDKVEKASNRVKAAVERRVSSHIIQGTAGDILRLVMLKLYKKYFKHRNPHIDFLSTVHDEINYTIDKEYTVDYVRELEDLMTFDSIDKTLPITTSTDVGFTYGNMFPFVWEDETRQVLIPKRVHHA